jgi:FAD/FMN-containing dehydrogenase
VVRAGERIRLGGPTRKDVAGYDLGSLLTGSEGTLGIIVSAWLRLVPAPEEVQVVVAAYREVEEGVAAILRVPGSGLVPATLEFFDSGCVDACRATLPLAIPEGAQFLVVSECDGSSTDVSRVVGEVAEALGPRAVQGVVRGRAGVAEMNRWRDGIGYAVRAVRGGKMSEDVAVPLDRLQEVIEATVDIGRRHALQACSWGHAGDGNVHATFLIDPDSRAEVDRAWQASEELFALALRLGGTVSGEHGLGWVKRSQFARQFGPLEQELQRGVKQLFDPAGIFNPGKKVSAGGTGAPQ